VRSFRFKCRLLSVLINICFYKEVLRNYAPFVDFALCHPFVPLRSALVEYAYIIAHLLFYATMLFDYEGLELMSATDDTLYIDSRFSNIYEPNDIIASRNGKELMKRISTKITVK
ncbi:hypothetical protein Tcan_11604, partial [Toxocara canis]